MPSRIYQYVINLVVSLPIMRGPGPLIDISMRENRALKTRFLCGEVYYSNTIIITTLM
jgi:hypothetical protein